MKQYALKLTAAVALAGVIHRAGSTVEVDEATAKNLLHRGKAELATEQQDAAEVIDADEVAAEQPATKQQDAAAPAGGRKKAAK